MTPNRTKATNGNCLSGSPDIILTRQRFKSAISIVFKELKKNASSELKENMRVISYQIEKLNKEIEIIK